MAEEAAAVLAVQQPDDQGAEQAPVEQDVAAGSVEIVGEDDAQANEQGSKRSREEDAGADDEQPEAKRAAPAGLEGQQDVSLLFFKESRALTATNPRNAVFVAFVAPSRPQEQMLHQQTAPKLQVPRTMAKKLL